MTYQMATVPRAEHSVADMPTNTYLRRAYSFVLLLVIYSGASQGSVFLLFSTNIPIALNLRTIWLITGLHEIG